MRVYRWDSSRGSFPWFAILLLVLGIGLLIEILIPDLSFGSLIILAAGILIGFGAAATISVMNESSYSQADASILGGSPIICRTDRSVDFNLVGGGERLP